MAYALALADAGTRPTGLHPGLVLLDEPLQQNPDPKHRTRFMQFLSKDLARTASFQTVIFTSLRTDEVTRLRKDGVSVQTPPPGKKWLQLLPVSCAPERTAGRCQVVDVRLANAENYTRKMRCPRSYAAAQTDLDRKMTTDIH